MFGGGRRGCGGGCGGGSAWGRSGDGGGGWSCGGSRGGGDAGRGGAAALHRCGRGRSSFPQFDTPVERGGENEVAEVDRPASWVEVQAHDRRCVAAIPQLRVDAGLGARTIVAVTGEDRAFFRAHKEGCRV